MLAWLLATLSTFGVCEPQTASDERPLFILSATDYLGKHTYDDHPYTQLLRDALAQLGYDLEIMHNPGLRSLAMANSGLVDGELVRIKDMRADYPNLLKVPEPLGRADLALFVATERAPASRRWTDFDATSVVALRGMVIMQYLPARFQELPQVRAQNYLQAMHLVIAGRADLAVLPASFIQKPENAELVGKLLPLAPIVGQVEGFVHLHKRHAGLVQPLAEKMRQLKQSAIAPAHTPASK